MISVAAVGIVFVTITIFLIVILVAVGSQFGISAVLKGLAFIVVAAVLLGVPFFWVHTTEISRPIEEAYVEQTMAPHMPISGQMEWSPGAMEGEESGDEALSPESAAGEIVGGESRAWSSSFEEEHVADLYSSPLEAAKSIARRCARVLENATEPLSQDVFVQFESQTGQPDDEVVTAFRSELRRMAPSLKLSASSSPESFVLDLRHDRSVGPGRLQAFRMRLSLDGDDHEFVTRFVNKRWVQNDLQFRLSENAPRKYIVARGDNDPNGESALEAAARYLEKDVEYYISQHRNLWGYSSSKLDGEFLAIARVAAISLTQDKFTQTFDTKADGSRAEESMTREAILIDYTRMNLYSAIYAAKMGVEYRPNMGPHVKSYPTNSVVRRARPRLEATIPMIAVVAVCCVALLGISRFFDGEPSR